MCQEGSSRAEGQAQRGKASQFIYDPPVQTWFPHLWLRFSHVGWPYRLGSATFASLRSMRSRKPASPRPASPLRRSLQRLGVVLAGILLAVYPLDWAVWRVRLAADNGMGSVDVTDTTAATLKGNHFEVYSQQTMTVNCSRSLLPEAGAGPCWWLHRHPSSVTQY